MAKTGKAAALGRLDEALARLIEGRVLNARGEPREDREADEALVSAAATMLRNMQALRRRMGLAPWHAGCGQNARLQAELARRAKSGEMIEVMRLAAVIHLRSHLYGPDA
jgi:hypothetical protein